MSASSTSNQWQLVVCRQRFVKSYQLVIERLIIWSVQPDVNKLNLFAEPKSKTDQSSGTSNSIPCVPHKFTVPPPSHPVPPHPPPSSQTQRAPPQVQHNGPPPPLMHVHHNQVPPPPPTECISQQSNIPTYEIVPSIIQVYCIPTVTTAHPLYLHQTPPTATLQPTPQQ